MKEKRKNAKLLKFNFDVSTFRLLGRELITDRITALFELVKNSYDANSDSVTIEFINVNPISNRSRIIIRDDGLGMNLFELENKWMIIGTGSKRVTRDSPKPYFRKLVGKKGIGRFAVDKLGSNLLLETKKKGDDDVHFLETDWSHYEKIAKQQLKSYSGKKPKARKYFTDIENSYWTEPSDLSSIQGTKLEISQLNDPWSEEDVRRAAGELSKLISPLKKIDFPFLITIKAKEYPDFAEKEIENNEVGLSTVDFYLRGDKKKETQEVIKSENGELKKIIVPVRDMGPVNFQLYYFNQADKKRFQKSFEGAKIDGIKVYRDSLITTPFAEYAPKQDEERDILGIDKRRYSGFFDRVSSRDLIGIVEISDKDNPYIIDATNRQDFVDNKAYRELKRFIIEQIEQLEDYLKFLKEAESKGTQSNLKAARDNVKSFTEAVRAIKRKAPPKVKKQLAGLEKQARKVQLDLQKGIAEFNRVEKESVEQQNLYLSLMSLQDYAAEISHVVRTSLSKILRHAEFLKKNFPNPKYEDLYPKYVSRIFDEMKKLNTAVDFMLSYATSNTDFTQLNIKNLIEELFFRDYDHILQKENIKPIVEIQDSIQITHNRKFFEDIIENLISNSIKALKNQKKKIIKCSAYSEKGKYVILFSDNGPGIADEDKLRIFNIYFTKTADQGGAGIGLYIVKTRIQSMKGTVEVIDSELKPSGATFKITLPFANKASIS